MAYNGEERRKSIDYAERIAVLESRHDELSDDLKEVKTTVHSIADELTKYKGMLGGAAFLATCIVTAYSFAKEWIIDIITKGR